MRDFTIITKDLVTREYFESKLDKKKYKRKKLIYKACNDVCYLEFDNSFIEKGTENYRHYCLQFGGLIGEDEENDWKKIVFPFESFYNFIYIEYHYQLDILKDLLLPFIDEGWYVITDLADFVPIKEFVLYYNKIDED